MALKPELKEDILTLIKDRPMLVADLVNTLRGGFLHSSSKIQRTWKSFPSTYQFADELKANGFHIRKRLHGAGIAVYVWTAPFSEVYGRRAKLYPVTDW